MRKKQFLKITLKSDLCAGSGFAFAGVIDADVQYDRYGIPCISGRSLKGCLKESAVTFLELNDDILSELFGTGGSNQLSGIKIGNAEPEGAQRLRDEIDALPENYKPYLGTQNVLDYYTNVRAQTSIDGKKGSAKENTLRFTRVVNQYTDNREMVFYAPIEYDLDDVTEKMLKNIVKATRHIGSNRNRGLGNVMMALVPCPDDSIVFGSLKFDGSKKQKITFCVKNTAPLMLSQAEDSNSASYIGGGAVLGVLAGRYLSIPGNSPDDTAFKMLFLSERTQYSNLTLAVHSDQGWLTSEPVPTYIKRKKKTKDYVNMLKEADHRAEMTDNEIKKEAGNQPKKLRDHWLFRDDSDQPVKIAEVAKDIVYHHAKHKENSKGQEGLLYYFETIASGQFFAGDIIVDGCYADLMLQLIEMGDFHFGKSRTAQYGTCRMVDVQIKEYESTASHFYENDRVIVTFLSDAIFTDEGGNDTIEHDSVKKMLAENLGVAYNEDSKENDPCDYLTTKVITGYHTKWNFQRPQRMGIQAGSSFAFQLGDIAEIQEGSVGENQREGFGRFRIDRFDKMEYGIRLEKNTEQRTVGSPEAVRSILKASILDSLCKGKLRPVFDGKSEDVISISASALGRLTLMLTEVQNEKQDSNERLKLSISVDTFFSRIFRLGN